MNELEKLEKRKKRTRHILITVSVLFLFLMLVLPLLCIIASSLKEGFASPILDTVKTLTGKEPIAFGQYAKENANVWK